MPIQIRVSRQGLTECPDCKRHIRVADAWRDTICPFCSARLEDAAQRACNGVACAAERAPSVLERLRSLAGVQRSAVAASLLSFALATTGCEEQTAVPLYGIPPPTDAGGDNDATTGGADAELVDSGEIVPQPEYGLPPQDAGTAADAASPADASSPDAASADAASADAATGDDAAEKVDAGEPAPVPLYGISPPSDGGR